MSLQLKVSDLGCHPMFTSGVGLSTPNAKNTSARLMNVERESIRPTFWATEEPTELEIRQVRELHDLEKDKPQMQELQESEKGDYNGFFGFMIEPEKENKGFFGSTIGGFIFYILINVVGLLILFLLFEYLIGPMLMDIAFNDACFGFPGEDCS